MERPVRWSGECTKRADKRRRYGDCRNDERAVADAMFNSHPTATALLIALARHRTSWQTVLHLTPHLMCSHLVRRRRGGCAGRIYGSHVGVAIERVLAVKKHKETVRNVQVWGPKCCLKRKFVIVKQNWNEHYNIKLYTLWVKNRTL